ncbi:MAG TPA: S53 family peptidase [Acidimicrobiales bacterium]|nr:S53 family peptidase [Acidimicrobiales bacterium]
MPVLASLAMVATAVTGVGGVAALVTMTTAASQSVRPLPFAPSHVLSTTLSFPPSTDYCRQNLNVSCYQPAQFQHAYDLNPLYNIGLTGKGSTIVIVDAFGSPTIAADLQHFDQTFGLPDPPSFQVIQPAGAVPAYPADPFGPVDRSGWAAETTLDVEWSHVMAPGANILLVETPESETAGVQGFPQIVQAENYVINHNLGDVISQSFGAAEPTFPSKKSILALRSAFGNAAQHQVTVLAASGDQGASGDLPDLTCCYPARVTSWPSSDPLVTSVGGTQLHLDANGNRLAPDNVWNDVLAVGQGASGGGRSMVFNRPAFQDPVSGVVGGSRGTPDVSLSAAIDGAVDFYYSFCDYGRAAAPGLAPPLCGPQWHLVGGTSEAAPLFAGIVAIADQAAGHRLGWLNPALYSPAGQRLNGGLVDVTAGNNTYAFCSANCGKSSEIDSVVPGFHAGAGHDLASGLGTIDATRFVAALVPVHQVAGH